MQQLEVIKLRDVVPVTAIPRFVSVPNPTIEVIGDDFSSVEEVFVNEERASEFIVVNKNTLWVQLPLAAQKTIDTIEVISSKFTRTLDASKITFKIGNNTKRVTGILKLTQLFTKWILQSPGTDIFAPRRGGGLQEIIGQLVSIKRKDPMVATITRAVETAAKQIKAAQVNYPGLPRDERLLSATLLDLNIFEKRMIAAARIQVTSIAGDEAISGLIL